MSIVDVRPTVEAPDDDPYLRLEETESPQALAWVEAQNSATMKRFFDSRLAADRDALKLIFDRPDNIPFPNRRGKELFNPWQDAEHPRGQWRTTSLDSFRSENPEWDVLIDLDALAAKEGEDWVWRGGRRCRERMTGLSFISRVEGRMRVSYARSISQLANSLRMVSICPRQEARLSGLIATRCCLCHRSDPIWQPAQAYRAR